MKASDFVRQPCVFVTTWEFQGSRYPNGSWPSFRVEGNSLHLATFKLTDLNPLCWLVSLCGTHHVFGSNIFISQKLFHITTQQKGAVSCSLGGISSYHPSASSTPMTDLAFSPALQRGSCQFKIDDSCVPKVRHNFWEYFMLKFQERRSCVKFSWNYFSLWLGLPKLRNGIKVKIKESKFSFSATCSHPSANLPAGD